MLIIKEVVQELDVHVPTKCKHSASYIRGKYYVYALFKKNSTHPFYVGKGINNRVNQHFMDGEIRREVNRKSRVIRKYKDSIRREILVYFDEESSAFDFEEYLIAHYKLIGEGGCLLNVMKSRSEFPESSKKVISEKKISRQIVYTEQEVLTFYINYFEKRMHHTDAVRGTSIPKRYATYIYRGERFRGLYEKYIESGVVQNLRLPGDSYIRKSDECQKVSDSVVIELFEKVCSGVITLNEACVGLDISPYRLGKIFSGESRRYLNLDYDLYKSIPKGKHVSRERAYLIFKDMYLDGQTEVKQLVKLVGRSHSVVNRFIRRLKSEQETQLCPENY